MTIIDVVAQILCRVKKLRNDMNDCR